MNKLFLAVLLVPIFLACAAKGPQPASSDSGAAPAAGSRVRIETESGAIEGTLVDKIPDGYLLRLDGEATQVVPFATVKSIETLSAPARRTGK